MASQPSSTEGEESVFEVYEKLKPLLQKLETMVHSKKQEAEKLEELRKRINSVSKRTPKIIKLNVGGKIFATNLDTLTLEKNTFFSALLSEEFGQQPEEDGAYFIDQDNTFFHLILNHLRGQSIEEAVQEMSKGNLKMFKQQVEYFHIPSLMAMLELSSPATAGSSSRKWTIDTVDYCNTSNQLRQVTPTSIEHQGSDGNFNQCFFGTMGFTSGTHKWRVRVSGLNNNAWIGLGVCVKQSTKQHSTAFNQKLHGFASNGFSWNSSAQYASNNNKWKDGDVLELCLNCDNKTLSCVTVTTGTKNEIRNLPSNVELHPMFIAAFAGNKIELL